MNGSASRCVAIASLLCGLVVTSPITAQDLSLPERNFEHLWQTFDRNYALFGAKRIDWDALYKVYRPRVTARTTDDELFDVMASLLGHLNDNHVRLQSPARRFRSGILGEMTMDDFSLDLIKERYLQGKFTPKVTGVFHYGWASRDIGYFHFRNFGNRQASTEAIDEIVAAFAQAKAIIVDVRGNGGGDDRVGKLIADRFADRKRLYMRTQIRNGPKHGDFTPPKYWYVEPDGQKQFTRPVILLTHRFSVSAAENFALAMRQLPHVTVVGDATSGVFADVYTDRLPNGWTFGVSYKLFVDEHGFCWEGIGVPMDIRQINTKQDIAAGRDRVLELALGLIESGALKPQRLDAGLKDLRQSLAKNLGRDAGQHGISAALRAFAKARSGPADAYYVDEEEMIEVVDALATAGKTDDALEVLTVSARQFPQSYAVFQRLGKLQLERGETSAGRVNLQKASALNRRSYPWELADAEEARKLLSAHLPQ